MLRSKGAGQLTILLVDDDPIILRELATILARENYEILVANGGVKALELLQINPPDIILLDIHMPDVSGLEVCRKIKKDTHFNSIPIIFLTASTTEVEEAFNAGAVDYLLKPLHENELKVRVNTHLKIAQLVQSLEVANTQLASLNATLEEKVAERTQELVVANKNLRTEISERRHLEDRLAYLSKYDFVTRMLNRLSMEASLSECLMQRPINNENQPRTHYFLYLDLDQFRIVNDTCSYLAGDEMLRQIGEILKSTIDKQDTVARMGGDEFALLFEADSMESAISKTSKIKTRIEDFTFEWEENEFQLGVSMGLIEIDQGFYEVEQVISIAERTCFEIKSRGGREFSIYNHSKEHIDSVTEQLHWIPIIQQAIREDKFFLIAQKIVDLHDSELQKYELLLRLEADSKKVFPPGHFIPIAERYHMITDIDKWVIKEAFKHKHLLKRGIELSINISGESFIKESFIEFVEKQIQHCKEYAHLICFEITETSAISQVAATQNFIERLKTYGCQFSLDDFGTGTSSYGQLKDLAIDYLKIDGVFVRGIEEDKINRKMVESMKSISDEMNIKTVAECVEAEEALAILKEIGIDYIQGYLFDKGTRVSDI